MFVAVKPFDLETAKIAILKEGIPFLDSAKAFLKQYGGRHIITYQERQNGLNAPKKVVAVSLAHFDALRAVEITDPLWFKYYADQIGKEVTPIGACGQEHAVLMIDDASVIYAGYDESLGKIASSPEEAILELLDRTRGQWESIPLKEEKNAPDQA